MKKILYIEDDIYDFMITFLQLKSINIQLHWLPDIYSCLRYLTVMNDKINFDLILLDYLGTSSIIDDTKDTIYKIKEIAKDKVYFTSSSCELCRLSKIPIPCIDKKNLKAFIFEKLNVSA